MQSVSTSGVFVTTTPLLLADSISILLKPTPKFPIILAFLLSDEIILLEYCQ